MIILNNTAKTVQALLDGAVTANQLPIYASYIDLPTIGGGASDTQTNGATSVTAVGAPPNNATYRQVKLLTIFNADTASVNVTVRLANSGVFRTLVKVTLAVGSTLVYADGLGWNVINSSGQIITSGSASGGASILPSTTGAVDGDGSTANPLAVRVDGHSIIIDPSNNLSIPGGDVHAKTHVGGVDPLSAISTTITAADLTGPPAKTITVVNGVITAYE